MATDDAGNARKKGSFRRPKGRLTIELVADALRRSAGIMSAASEKLNVDRTTVAKFVKKHHKLQVLIQDIADEMNDLAESGLLIALRNREPWAIKMWLMQRGQARGYNPRKLAFKDQDGQIVVPAVLVTDGKMTEDDWAATDWAAQGKSEPATIN